MINISGLSKSYGGQTLFKNVVLQMNAGERLGLVGRNGHGKSTLFRIILGEEEADEGTIATPRNYRIGHLAQHLHFTQPTVLEEGCLGLPPGEEDDHYKVERILFGLGFSYEDMYRAPSEFSGGYQIRLNLTKLLVSNPNMLLLDEPTNYLDIVSVRWIIQFLRQWRGELILISHDRDFMDQVTTHTAAIHRHQLRKIPGGTEKLYAQILQDEEIYEKTRANEEKKRKQIESFVERFRAKASKASSVQSRVKQLARMPALEKLAQLDDLDFQFRYAPFYADNMMRVENLSFGYTEELPLIENLNFEIKAEDRIAVIGKNGKGKSTLLALLAGELKPQQGEIKSHPELRLGYFGQTNIDRLHPQMTIEEEIQSSNNDLSRTAVRNICGTMMFSGDAAEKKISVLSGGERSRVMLGKILAQPSNLILLDEPTNHLDMESIEALTESIQEFPGAVVIVTHSEMILNAIATKLIVFQHGKVEVFNGSYEEFLEKIGWEEEEGNKSKKKKQRAEAEVAVTAAPEVPETKSNPVSQRERRKQRSDIIAERSKTLGPFKKEMEALEQEIISLESQQTADNQALLEASQKNEVDAFVKLSKTVKEYQTKIDAAYEKLAKVTEKYDQKSQEFESQLSETE